MRIRFSRRGRRSQLLCVRPDGTVERAALGANVPLHDLAHYVVERRWGLEQGFYGNIARGRTLAELSDPQVIRGLDPQSLQAEVLSRGVQSVLSGACAVGQCAALVNAELAQWHTPAVQASAAQVQAAVSEFADVAGRYRSLADGESLTLEFEPAHPTGR